MAKVPMLAFVTLVIFTATANATTLEITSGGIYTDQLALFDTCVSTGGDVSIPFTCLGGASQFWPPWGQTTSLARLHVGSALIDSVWYAGTADPLHFNLIMNFAHKPVPNDPADYTFPYMVPDPVSLPFTMTGMLTLLDSATSNPITFDLIGQGMMNCCYYPDPLSGYPLIRVGFQFSPVPEPSTIVLLMFGTAVSAAYVLTRRLRKSA